MGIRPEQWRREGGIEHDGLVAHLDDARHPQTAIARLGRAPHLERKAGMGNLQVVLQPHRGGAVGHALAVEHIARGAAGLVIGADLAPVRIRHRQGQPDEMPLRALGHRDGMRQKAGGGQIEGQPVGKDPRCPAQAEKVLFRQIGVDLEMREPPGVGRGMAAAQLQQMLDIAVRLLKVMGLKEEPLFPGNLALP